MVKLSLSCSNRKSLNKHLNVDIVSLRTDSAGRRRSLRSGEIAKNQLERKCIGCQNYELRRTQNTVLKSRKKKIKSKQNRMKCARTFHRLKNCHCSPKAIADDLYCSGELQCPGVYKLLDDRISYENSPSEYTSRPVQNSSTPLSKHIAVRHVLTPNLTSGISPSDPLLSQNIYGRRREMKSKCSNNPSANSPAKKRRAFLAGICSKPKNRFNILLKRLTEAVKETDEFKEDEVD